jgi:hypothetical protein
MVAIANVFIWIDLRIVGSLRQRAESHLVPSISAFAANKNYVSMETIALFQKPILRLPGYPIACVAAGRARRAKQQGDAPSE